jgi:Ni,Fe-hydrogenase III large subunit/Ni,Fe-hydrogenase III component G
MVEYRNVLPESLVGKAKELEKKGYSLALMFANDERQINRHFAVYAIFAGHGQFQSLKVLIQEGAEEFPSLTLAIPAAGWYEREINDLFGIKPVGHPDLRPLVLHENWPEGVFPLRKDFSDTMPVPEGGRLFPMNKVYGEGIFEVPVGPIHAGIIEPGHFRFSQAGEDIINLDAKLFFTHRGIEKAVEGLPLEQAIYQAERICGACAVSHGIAFSQAVEALAGVQVSMRAQYLRVLVAEMERLYNHVGDIGNLCAGVGFAVGTSHGSRLKEWLMRLNEAVTGNRFLRGMVVPGGVSMDVTSELLAHLIETMDRLKPELEDLVGLLKAKDAFLDRINRTGILPKQAAADLGVVGVAARASGIHVDMRKDHPYSVYDSLDFSVPVYRSGDVAARLWVRAAEAEQAIALIRQTVRELRCADGKLIEKIPPIVPYASAIGWSESARGGNIHWLMAGKDNTVYRYFVRSASYPNWPAVAVASPGNIIPDFPLINKSFELCYACIDR